MAFRYRIVLYHENQRWVPDLVAMLDKPMFHLFSTDDDTAFERELDTGDVDIILSSISTKHFVLQVGKDDTLKYKKEAVWEKIIHQKHHCQVILLCRSDQVEEATELVQSGKSADYFVITPMVDKTRLYVAILKALQFAALHDLVAQKMIHGENLPRDVFESIERVQELIAMPDPEPEPFEPPPPPQPSLPDDALFAQAAAFPDEGEMEEEEEEAPQSALEEDSIFGSFPGSALPEDSVFNAFPGSISAPQEESAFGGVPGDNFSAASVFSSLQEDFFMPEPTPVEAPVYASTPNTDFPYKYTEGTAPILIIENNIDNIELVTEILTARGYRHHIVGSAQEGLFQLTNSAYRLLMVGLELNDTNTLDMVRSIRQVGPQESIPIIVISSGAEKHDVLLCRQAGADHLIVKPFKPEVLMAHVKEYLGRVKT